MSLLSRALGIRASAPTPTAPVATRRIVPVGAGTSPMYYNSPGQPTPAVWDGLTAINNGYLTSIYIMGPVRVIATALGSLPFRVGADPDKPADYNINAPLARLLGPPPGGPNPVTSPRNLWIWSLVQRLICGRMAWETPHLPQQTAPVALWPLVAPFVDPVPSQNKASWFDGYTYRLPTGRISYTPDKMFYAWRPSQLDFRQPESALQAANLPASLQIALDRYMWNLARNGLSANKLIVTPDFAEDDERRAFEEQFAAEFTGYANAGRVMHAYYEPDPAEIASNTSKPPSVQVLDLGTTPADAQVLEILKAVKDDMLRAWRVPMSWMGDSSQRTYENASQEAKNFWQGPVLELAAEVCDDVNLMLAPRFGDGNVGWFDFSRVEALKPGQIFAQISPDAAVKAGLADAEDWRNDVGLPPLPGQAPSKSEVEEEPPAVDDTPGGTSMSNFSRREDIEVLVREVLLDERLRAGAVYPETGLRYDVSPLGEGKNWVTKVGGLPLFIRAIAHALIRNGHNESNAVQMAVGIVQNWARGGGKVTAKTRAKAAAALAEWEAKKGASHATPNRQVTESSGAALLLPKGVKASQVHLFMPSQSDRKKCAVCGQPILAPLHKAALPARSRVRHAGKAGHVHLPSGHLTSLRKKTLAATNEHADRLEPDLAKIIRSLFAKQKKATLSRLQGRRGATWLRATQDIGPGPTPQANAGAIFDTAFWTAETQQAVNPVLAAVDAMTVSRLAETLLPSEGPAQAASDAVKDALAQRGLRLAQSVTQTTANAISQALTDGLMQGEGIAGLTKRVEQVFADADSARAELIARTEVMGSINTAQDAYASTLGDDVVAHKEWLAVDDHRTRETHRLANGQTRPLGTPFTVGGYPMQHPGDPTAPPDEVCNCRCTTVYVPVRKPKTAMPQAA